MADPFIIARNPEADSSLPYRVFLPIDGGMWLKARETCHGRAGSSVTRLEKIDVATLDLLEPIDVVSCERPGAGGGSANAGRSLFFAAAAERATDAPALSVIEDAPPPPKRRASRGRKIVEAKTTPD